jgi:hypothetical protein
MAGPATWCTDASDVQEPGSPSFLARGARARRPARWTGHGYAKAVRSQPASVDPASYMLCANARIAPAGSGERRTSSYVHRARAGRPDRATRASRRRVSKADRTVRAQLESIPSNEERLLLATGRYIGEGFDDARLDTLFLALPVSWKGTLVQYTGRLHRLHPGKREVRIFDYVDREVPMLLRMFEKRLRGYRAIGTREARHPLGMPSRRET